MRIALLSTLDREGQPGNSRAAFANFAGAMIVERQLDLAIRLGCKRVACLVDAVDSEIVQLQHRAEQAGLKFRAIRHPSRLSGMVTNDDDLLVLAAAVLPDDEAVVQAVDATPAILAFPADLAVPLGYERIDLELAWAGVMLIPGAAVGQLDQLPDDVDVPSALMRIALQSSTKASRIDRSLLADGRWHLAPSREALDLREKAWIDGQRRQIAFRAPGMAVAERAGGRVARDILGTPAEGAPAVLAAVSALGALGAGSLGYLSIGMGLATLTALLVHIGSVVERVALRGRPQAEPSPLLAAIAHATDLIFTILLILAAPREAGLLGAFVPLVLFGLLRLGQRHSSEIWRCTYADRILLGLLLIPATFFGFATEMAAGIALLVLVTRFFAPFREG